MVVVHPASVRGQRTRAGRSYACSPWRTFRTGSSAAIAHPASRWALVRGAIEPWHTLGEQTAATGTARYVDSSVERLRLRVVGADHDRYVVTCYGMPVPLLATDKADVQVT